MQTMQAEKRRQKSMCTSMFATTSCLRCGDLRCVRNGGVVTYLCIYVLCMFVSLYAPRCDRSDIRCGKSDT